MPESTKDKIRFLVAEDEPDLREIIVFFLESNFNATVVEAANGEIAKQILENDSKFEFVISDYNMPIVNGGQLLQFIREASFPIKFILVSAANISEIKEFSSVQPDGHVEKPGFSQKLKSLVRELLPASIHAEPLSEYSRVSIKQLFSLGVANYPLFAKLSDQKYVKVIHQDEPFRKDEFDRFKNKNIDYLYIENKHSNGFFDLLKNSYLARLQVAVTSSEKTAITLDIATAIQEMASIFGFSPQLEEMTKAGVTAAMNNISKSSSLKSLLDELKMDEGGYLAIHSSRLPYLANHISTLMGWESESTALKMAYSSMLHDSVIHDQLHEKFDSDDTIQSAELSLSNKDLELFMYHPIKAADVAKQFKGMPPDVDVIIAQHHENCDGTGFPHQLNHTKISPLSSAFIIAHDLLCFYEKSGDQFKMEDFVKEYESKYTSGFFKKIMKQLSTHPFK